MTVIIIALEKPGKKVWTVDIAAPNDWRVPKKSKERWTNIKRLGGVTLRTIGKARTMVIRLAAGAL